jgi:hypothetical protein
VPISAYVCEGRGVNELARVSTLVGSVSQSVSQIKLEAGIARRKCCNYVNYEAAAWGERGSGAGTSVRDYRRPVVLHSEGQSSVLTRDMSRLRVQCGSALIWETAT